ncbi:MAG: arginine N-succinyltransferase [Myxococcales bacterium FL481]|nr:MAG: arginine N-succinyltransferase [Myxococcales bacterium FL481]
MFLFRPAREDDEDAVLALASHLNTLNLAPDRRVVTDLLRQSAQGFSGSRDEFRPERYLLFVLEDEQGEVVGTSSIFAQHGTAQRAHYYFAVNERTREAVLDGGDGPARHVSRVLTTLTLGRTEQGPTEIGGLVLHPRLRGHPDKLGRLVSLGRFLVIAGFRAWFRDRVLAELLPPLRRGRQGELQSDLWDAIGAKCTGLPYAEADALSRVDNRFIGQLFPDTPIHVELLPMAAQAVIGQVGPATKGARHLLERIGFAYRYRIDPFDGGPHFEAETDRVGPVRTATWVHAREGDVAGGAEALVARLEDEHPRVRVLWTRVGVDGAADAEPERVRLSEAALMRLGYSPREGGRVLVALGGY